MVDLMYMGIALLVAIGLAVPILMARHRHRRDYREDLEPILETHGLTFVSARWPGLFRVGPFPKIEIQDGRLQSRVGGIRGEYDEHRIVTVEDSRGREYELWAKLEFELFRLRRIRWRAEKELDFPPQFRALLNEGSEECAR
jgi:hypothetical protein